MYVRLEKGGAPREGVPQTAIRYKIYDPWGGYTPWGVVHECNGVTWYQIPSVLPMNRAVSSWLPHRARIRL